MKSIYESILDDQDDIINGAEDQEGVKTKAGEGWLHNHGFRNAISVMGDTYTQKIKFGSFEGDFTGLKDDMSDVLITKKDTVTNIPEYIPPVLLCNKFYVKGFTGKEIPDRIVPRQAKTVIIANCPNLVRLPQLPDEVETFSVTNCPKVVSLEGCPTKASKLFKAVDCGRKFDWRDISRVCKVTKRNSIY